MQKNLVLAVVLSSAVYLLWYAFIEKPQPAPASPAVQTSQAADASSAQPAQPSAPGAAPAAPQPAAAVTDWQKTAVEIKLQKAAYLFHASGASLKSIVYQGPVAPLELIPDPAPGFLSSFENLNFSLKNKNSDSVTFAADAPNGVTVTKKFTLNGEEKISLLEVTAGRTAGVDAAAGAGAGHREERRERKPRPLESAVHRNGNGEKAPHHKKT